MSDESGARDSEPDRPQTALRVRTFLKGIVYYNNRAVSIDCTIRDLSESGARIAFTTLVTVPDIIELHIPQKQRTFAGRVMRREQYEIGVSFEDQRSGEPRRGIDGELAERVAKLENELVAVNRLLRQLKTKVFPNDGEIK